MRKPTTLEPYTKQISERRKERKTSLHTPPVQSQHRLRIDHPFTVSSGLSLATDRAMPASCTD